MPSGPSFLQLLYLYDPFFDLIVFYAYLFANLY